MNTAWALASFARTAVWVETLGRAWLGGAVDPTAVTPTGTPGGPVPASIDVSALLLLSVAVFAFLAYLRSFGREWRAVLVVGVGYVLLDRQWDFVARWVNHFYKLFVFAVVKRGVLVDDPTAAWKEVGTLPGLVPSDAGAVVWQITLFTVGVIGAYVFSTLAGAKPVAGPLQVFDLHNMVLRVLGSLAGGASGYLIGLFYLVRLFPGAHAGGLGLGETAASVFTRFGPLIVMGTVLVLIVFGVASMGARRKKVYS